ncbi:hypothetical protein R6Q59_020164 [Mikania micrantha]
MYNGRISTTASVRLSIMMLMMVMMIKHCDGWMAACNDSTTTDCPLLANEEQEFLMDTEEHRRILAGNSNHLSYDSLEAGNPACGNNCGGRYDPAGRQCKNYDRSCR